MVSFLPGCTSVFIDDPTVKLDKERDDYATEVQARFSNSTNSHGWLSYKTAQIIDRKKGIEVEQIKTKAKSEGRTVSAADYASIGVPTPMSGVIDTPVGFIVNPGGTPNIMWQDFKVTGTQAQVTYDDGALMTSFLIKTKDGWRIAGIHVIKTHYGGKLPNGIF